MFRICDGRTGMGNLFIYISQIDERTPVSSKIYDGYRGKYINFINLNIVDDDPKLPSIKTPDIYINEFTVNNIHPVCRNKIKPSDVLLKLINENKHLIEDIECGLAIRTSDPSCGTIADESTLNTFEKIIENSTKKIFIACDSLEHKLHLNKKYPNKINFLNGEPVHINNHNTIDSPLPFLEFFLLSMCPILYLTGGPKDMTKFSTFGYMASIYGNVPFNIIWNSYP